MYIVKVEKIEASNGRVLHEFISSDTAFTTPKLAEMEVQRIMKMLLKSNKGRLWFKRSDSELVRYEDGKVVGLATFNVVRLIGEPIGQMLDKIA